MAFPSSPTDGQTYEHGGQLYTWSGALGLWQKSRSGLAAATAIAAGTHTAITATYNATTGALSLAAPSALITSSSTAPSSPVLGARWHDTVSGTRFEWDGTAWIEY